MFAVRLLSILIIGVSALAAEVLTIATFNIKQLGPTKMGRPAVVSELSEIIARYGVVAVQEVKNAEMIVADQLLAAINARGGAVYAMSESPRTGLHASDRTSQEQYVYYYDTAVLTALDAGALYPDESDQFQREPWVTRFETVDGFSFVLISVHTKPDDGGAITIGEISALHDVRLWAQSIYPDEDDFIILGDLNADGDYAEPGELDQHAIRGPDYVWIVPDDADTTVSEGTSEAYDRIIVWSSAEHEHLGDYGVDRQMSGVAVSDHYPVWATFSMHERVAAEEATTGPNSVAITAPGIDALIEQLRVLRREQPDVYREVLERAAESGEE